MNKKFVLFDFDGVIVDSFEIAFETRREICPHVSEEEYRSRFEGNIYAFEEAVQQHTPACKLNLDWFSIFVPKMERAAVVEGMEKSLADLAERYTLIVVSSTITVPIEDLLVKEGLRHYFAEVMGADVHTSKVEKIKMIFEKYGATPKDCIFITDTLGDMREAEETGIEAIGVTWGFHAKETLMRGNPAALVERAQDLVPAVDARLGASI